MCIINSSARIMVWHIMYIYPTLKQWEWFWDIYIYIYIYNSKHEIYIWKVIAQSAYKSIVPRIVQKTVTVNALTTLYQLNNLHFVLLQHCYNKIRKTWLAVASFVNWYRLLCGNFYCFQLLSCIYRVYTQIITGFVKKPYEIDKNPMLHYTLRLSDLVFYSS